MTLNEEQTLAVETDASLAVVIAGPGSGKTRVEVERVKWIARGMDSIAIMTFTNAGAAEFRERLGDLADKLSWCGTTHSYCFQLIQRFGHLIGYKQGTVSIMPKDDSWALLLRVRDELGLKKISQATLLAGAGRATHDQVALVWKEYAFRLKQSNLVDYDGILSEGLRLLLLDDVRCRMLVDHLLVDEFQDSQATDVAIYAEIPAANRFFVGDPDQSIFGFRKADPGFLLTMARDKGVATFNLEKNYRSANGICEAANKLIANNKDRIPKMSVSVSGYFGQVAVDEYDNGFSELDRIAGCIGVTLATNQSIAVLYRNNFEVEQCVQNLVARGFPVKVRAAQMKPKDLERAILLLSLALSPDNEILLERYLLLDMRGLEVAQLLLTMKATGGTVRSATQILTAGCGVGGFLGTQQMMGRNRVSESTIRLVTERAKMLGNEALAAELIHDLRSYEPELETADESERHIYVGTYHSAKGREWDVVFLPAFEQGIIPHKIEPVSLLEEERRLAFVAVTRARHELYFSWAAEGRGKWGPRSLGRPSQFLQEMGL